MKKQIEEHASIQHEIKQWAFGKKDTQSFNGIGALKKRALGFKNTDKLNVPFFMLKGIANLAYSLIVCQIIRDEDCNSHSFMPSCCFGTCEGLPSCITGSPHSSSSRNTPARALERLPLSLLCVFRIRIPYLLLRCIEGYQ